MRDALVVSVLSCVPRNRWARWMGRFARGRASRWFTRGFVRLYGIDLSEAEVPPGGFQTLDELFTRRLRPDARPVAAEPCAMVSPVDGTCAFVGRVEEGVVPIAPGRTFGVEALVGEPRPGPLDVVVLYLSPRDYHRVHVPREGAFRSWRYLPGTLWPVFPSAVRRVEGLFARNERLACHLETSQGPLDVVLVGAFGVGRISVVGVPLWTNEGATSQERGHPDVALSRGADLGCFHLGSTVVLVAPSGRWRWQLEQGAPVRWGQTIATACEASVVVPPSGDRGGTSAEA